MKFISLFWDILVFFVEEQPESLANFWAQLILGHQIYFFKKHRVLVVGTNFRFCQVPDSTIEKQWHFTVLMWPFRIEEWKFYKNPQKISSCDFIHKFCFFYWVSVDCFFFNGAEPYNWWKNVVAKIEAINYALLSWLVIYFPVNILSITNRWPIGPCFYWNSYWIMVTKFFEVYFALLGNFVFFCRATGGGVGQFLSAVDTWSSNIFF